MLTVTAKRNENADIYLYQNYSIENLKVVNSDGTAGIIYVPDMADSMRTVTFGAGSFISGNGEATTLYSVRSGSKADHGDASKVMDFPAIITMSGGKFDTVDYVCAGGGFTYGCEDATYVAGLFLSGDVEINTLRACPSGTNDDYAVLGSVLGIVLVDEVDGKAPKIGDFYVLSDSFKAAGNTTTLDESVNLEISINAGSMKLHGLGRSKHAGTYNLSGSCNITIDSKAEITNFSSQDLDERFFPICGYSHEKFICKANLGLSVTGKTFSGTYHGNVNNVNVCGSTVRAEFNDCTFTGDYFGFNDQSTGDHIDKALATTGDYGNATLVNAFTDCTVGGNYYGIDSYSIEIVPSDLALTVYNNLTH